MHEVIYFTAAAQAEPIRICLHIGNVQWKDTRIPFQDWPAYKPSTPMGVLPVLKISSSDDDDSSAFTHCQSVALMRYAAKLAGMYPEDPIQALFVDEVMDSVSEIYVVLPIKKEGMSEDDFKVVRQEYQKTTVTKVAVFVESIIQMNGGSSVAKGQATVADLFVYALVKSFLEAKIDDYLDKDFFSAYPGIMATSETIMKLEGVVSYYESYKAETCDFHH